MITAHIVGPYCTGAPAWAGARPVLVLPHGQRRLMIWCSVTCTLIGGMSKTCRREQSTSAAPVRSDPQPRQHEGSWRITTSGSDTCCRVCPRCPSCPPGFRFEGRRNDRGAGALGPSDEGGFDEFCEFVRNCASKSATRTFSAEFSARRESSSTRISTISSTNSVYVGCVIPQLLHCHQFSVRQHAHTAAHFSAGLNGERGLQSASQNAVAAAHLQRADQLRIKLLCGHPCVRCGRFRYNRAATSTGRCGPVSSGESSFDRPARERRALRPERG